VKCKGTHKRDIRKKKKKNVDEGGGAVNIKGREGKKKRADKMKTNGANISLEGG